MAGQKKPPKRFGCLSGCLAIVLIGFALLALLSQAGRQPGGPRDERPAAQPAAQPAAPALMPEVATFLAAHPEFGTPTGARDVPNWAEGKRQRVQFDSGRDLLFYEKGGAIITVWADDPPGRRVVWGETER